MILRPLNTADAETIYKNWTSDPEVAKFMRWNLHTSPEDTRAWLQQEETQIASPCTFTWGFVLKKNDKLIGSGGLVLKKDLHLYELGYNIMKEYWNLGLTSEAAEQIVSFAEDELEQEKLFACHSVYNPASGRVLEKIGFQYLKDGEYQSFDGTRTFTTRDYRYLSPKASAR